MVSGPPRWRADPPPPARRSRATLGWRVGPSAGGDRQDCSPLRSHEVQRARLLPTLTDQVAFADQVSSAMARVMPTGSRSREHVWMSGSEVSPCFLVSLVALSRRLARDGAGIPLHGGCCTKGSKKLRNLSGGRRIAIRSSGEGLVPFARDSRPLPAWVVPSQIDAPDPRLVFATASMELGSHRRAGLSCARGPKRKRGSSMPLPTRRPQSHWSGVPGGARSPERIRWQASSLLTAAANVGTAKQTSAGRKARVAAGGADNGLHRADDAGRLAGV